MNKEGNVAVYIMMPIFSKDDMSRVPVGVRGTLLENLKFVQLEDKILSRIDQPHNVSCFSFFSYSTE